MDICRLSSLDRILPEFTSRNRVVKRPLQDVLSPKRCRKDSNSFFATTDNRAFFVDCWIVFVSLLPVMLKFLGKNRQATYVGGDYSKLIVETRFLKTCSTNLVKIMDCIPRFWEI